MIIWTLFSSCWKVDSSREDSAVEQLLLESLITTMVGNDEVTSTAHAFLQANSGVDVCQKLLNTWNRWDASPVIGRIIAALACKYLSTVYRIFYSYLFSSLRPSTRKILALAAEVKTLENDKEHLRFNLARAEEEVSSTWLIIYSINGALPIDKLFSSMCLGESIVWGKWSIAQGE